MASSGSPDSRRESGGREDEFKQQHHYQQQRDSKPKLWRKLQVQKSTALGLVVPGASLQLEVRNVDRSDQDLGPAYRTSKLHWEECFITMLPKFDLYLARDDTITGLGTESGGTPTAKISRILWNCARSTLARFEMFRNDESPKFDNSLPLDIRKTWSLHQKGLGRQYNLIGSNSSKNAYAGDESQKKFTGKARNTLLSTWRITIHHAMEILKCSTKMATSWPHGSSNETAR